MKQNADAGKRGFGRGGSLFLRLLGKADSLFLRYQARTVAEAIKNALVTGQPAFRVVRYEPPRPDTFTLQTRQRMGFGYREYLIVGAEVRENETRILFKVMEYTHPPDLSLLGGLLTFKSDPAAPAEDPNVARAKAEKFQARVKEGLQIVTERIQQAMSPDGR